LAHGDVLEIGFGPGVNLAYYDLGAVSTLYALEPSESMIRIAERHPRRRAFAITFLDLPGEQIPLQDGAVDTVVSTFTLCTVSNIADVMGGITRVIRLGGKLIFLENSAAPDPAVRRWQRWWGPVPRPCSQGLILPGTFPPSSRAQALTLSASSQVIWRDSQSPGPTAAGDLPSSVACFKARKPSESGEVRFSG
jgi:SAM-dependent methyltransferase